jgi:serine/threonine-protein kinase RsbW
LQQRHAGSDDTSLLALSAEVGSILASSAGLSKALQSVVETVARRLGAKLVLDYSNGESAANVSAGEHGSGLASMFAVGGPDETLGALQVVRGKPLTPEERTLLLDLVSRIGLGIKVARQNERERQLGEVLQRALLPHELPATGRLKFDAAYRPAAQESAVGGDFYDAFELPDGRIAVSIGDATGHGLSAAIAMSEVRHALRAAAINPKSPSLVLERANAIVNMRRDPTIVTAAFGILDPRDLTFTYACAGHPAPIFVLDPGTATGLPGGGIPLGVTDSIDAESWTFTLVPGSLLLFYTDGIVEYDRRIDVGEKHLQDVARWVLGHDPDRPASLVTDTIFAGRTNEDDVAVLSVTPRADWGETLDLTMSAIPLAGPLLRHSARAYAQHLELADEDIAALELAIGETVSNVVLHAYDEAPGIVRVRTHVGEGTLVLSVEDWGRWNHTSAQEHGGRGLRLVRNLMDRVDIETAHRHTTVVARKQVAFRS